jgi:hypothetical protein
MLPAPTADPQSMFTRVDFILSNSISGLPVCQLSTDTNIDTPTLRQRPNHLGVTLSAGTTGGERD